MSKTIYCITCQQSTQNPRFCSKSCSAKYNNRFRIRTESSKKKVSEKISNLRKLGLLKGGGRYRRSAVKFLNCRHCQKLFTSRGGRLTCSDFCMRSVCRKGKTHFYNGVVLDSNWELELAKWLDLKNIKWERPKYIEWFDGVKRRKYFPDFYLPEYDIYLDPKNRLVIKQDQKKLEEVTKKIKLFYGTVNEIQQLLLPIIQS